MSLYNRSHGLTGTKEYDCWINMKQRCNNPKLKEYANYGARGIKVCDEWQEDFATFLNHIGKAPEGRSQVDRINNEGNYEPGNVRWTTSRINTRNKRNNLCVDYQGRAMLLVDLCEEKGIKESVIIGRMRLGHTLEESLVMTLRPRGSKKYVVYQGETISVGNLSAKLGMKKDVLGRRLRLGWTLEKAITTPVT